MIRPEDVNIDETRTLDKKRHVFKAKLQRTNQEPVIAAVKVFEHSAIVTPNVRIQGLPRVLLLG